MIDIGANLANTAFTPDLPEVLARARSAGVTTIVATGTSLPTSLYVADIAAAHDNPVHVLCTSGIHPHAASTATPDALATIALLAEHRTCVAVGETGLDYHRMLSTKQAQQQSFAAHIELSKRIGKPLFLHCRDAFVEMHAMLVGNPCRAVVHCFTGTRSQAASWMDLGYDIGITGWLTQTARAQELQDALAYIPVDRLHVETDAPYLLPSTAMRGAPMVKTKMGWRCEPMHLPLVLQALAQHKKLAPEALVGILRANGKRLFGDDDI